MAVLRETGLQARPRLRRRDRSIGLSFTDGSAVRVTPDAVLLERAAPLASGMSGLFARGFARLRRWIDNTDGSAWPFPAPQRPGMVLAGTAAALRRHLAARVHTAEAICFHDDPARRATMLEMLRAEFGMSDAPVAGHGRPRQAHVLILTPECAADLARDPTWYLDRLKTWQAAYPDLGVITLGQDPGAARFERLDDLMAAIEAASQSPGEEPEDPEEAPAPTR